jgi:3'(2'), 5'-bisphosphate nucleotidase
MLIFNEPKKLLTHIVDITRQANQAALEIYRTPFDVTFKKDASLVMQADRVAHDLICSALRKLTPAHIPVLSEKSEYERIETNLFWLVDHFDRIKEFIYQNDEFTINITLIDNNLALLGVIYSYTLDLFYRESVKNGTFKISPGEEQVPISFESTLDTDIIAMRSHSHGNLKEVKTFLFSFMEKKIIHTIGSSLNFYKITEGSPHLYPYLEKTMELDIAVIYAILMATRSCMITLSDNILTYGKKDFENPLFMVFPSINFLRKLAADKENYEGCCHFFKFSPLKSEKDCWNLAYQIGHKSGY